MEKRDIDIFLKSHKAAEDIVNNLKSGNTEDLFGDFIDDSSQYEELKSRFADSSIKQQIMEEIISQDQDADISRLKNKLDSFTKHSLINRIRVAVTTVSIAAALIAVSFLIRQSEDVLTQESSQGQLNTEYTEPTLITNNEIVKINSNINKIDYLKIENGNLKYKATLADSIIMNKIIVPSGFTQSITLEDGTEILLNAQSELTYPNKFSSVMREVTLSGEAFFKVSKSGKPFIVKTDNGDVRVYGTEFNIYTTDKMIETILINGSVGVTLKDKKEIMISPNTMISYNNQSQELVKREVNAEKRLGWINKMFLYDDQNIERVLSDISNWFNVSFHYDKQLGDQKLSMNLHRDADIKEVIEFLEVVLNRKIILEERGTYNILKK